MVFAFTQTLKNMKANQITIPLVKEIFGDDNLETFVFKNDLFEFCAMKPIDVTIIVAYMRYEIKILFNHSLIFP